MQTTILYQQHLAANAKIVDFAGWQMPLHYGSQIAEHHQVRNDAGMFDVSHMAVVDVIGHEAKPFLQYLLANDVTKLESGKALYSCMLNETGGIIDDLIVYHVDDQFYRLVLNAGTRAKDLAWLQQQAPAFKVKITPRNDLAMIAIQGPHALTKTQTVLKKFPLQSLIPFSFLLDKDWLIARTGYTGEEGYEVILPVAEAVNFWQALLSAGIKPCGLGARDTLRLEAGLNLYGTDMDESTSPLESNLAWTIAWQPESRNFIGRAALTLQQQQGLTQKMVGLILKERGVLRNHQKIQVGEVKGEITSGSFSPTLGHSIALARIPVDPEGECKTEIRGKYLLLQIVKLPFVRHGKKVFT